MAAAFSRRSAGISSFSSISSSRGTTFSRTKVRTAARTASNSSGSIGFSNSSVEGAFRAVPGLSCLGCSGSGGKGCHDGGVRAAAALAHRLQAVADAGGSHVVEQRRGQPGAGGSQGMAEGNGAAVGVEPGRVGGGLGGPG